LFNHKPNCVTVNSYVDWKLLCLTDSDSDCSVQLTRAVNVASTSWASPTLLYPLQAISPFISTDNEVSIRQHTIYRSIKLLEFWVFSLGCPSCWLGCCWSLRSPRPSHPSSVPLTHSLTPYSVFSSLLYRFSITVGMYQTCHSTPLLMAVETTPNPPNSDRCTSLPPPIPNPTSLSVTQITNPVHAPCLCHHLIFLLPVLSKLYLLLSCTSRYVDPHIYRAFSDSPTSLVQCTRCVITCHFPRCNCSGLIQGNHNKRILVCSAFPTSYTL
jgi:hypothetical protein